MPWSIQTTDVNGGTYGIEAEAGNDEDSSNLFLIADFDAGDVTFYEKISAEDGFDRGVFMVDGDLYGSADVNVTGNAGSFTQRTIAISAGVNVLNWCYLKDDTDPSFDDTWYVDDIVVPAYTLLDLTNAERFGAVPTGTEWTDDATYPWRTYSRGMFDTGAVRSGSITHSQNTQLEYNSGSGASAGTAITIMRADSEGSSFDFLDYDIDASTKKSATFGQSAQRNVPIVSIETVTSGSHEYIWTYQKDSSDTSGADEGHLFLFYEPGMDAAAGGIAVPVALYSYRQRRNHNFG